MTRFLAVSCCCLMLLSPGSTVLRAQAESQLASSTYFGSFGFDEATDLVVDGNGFVYVSGWTQSFAFPSTGFDAFVLKLTPDGSQVVYTTYLRGSGFDIANGLAVHTDGSVYVVGHTASADFPLVNPMQSQLRGSSDVWLAKLDSTGAIVYSTYYGGSSFENGNAIAVSSSGDVYVAGSTGSLDLPGVTGFQPENGGGLMDGFVAKIRPETATPLWASYVGGNGDDLPFGVAVDASDHAVVVGRTSSMNFPLVSAIQGMFGGGLADGFITKFSPDGSSLVFSTYVGGSSLDIASSVQVDEAGAVHVAGTTGSFDFPTVNAFQPFFAGGSADGFIARFEPNGQGPTRSTFFGGQGDDVILSLRVDPSGHSHIAGQTDSFDFPLLSAVQAQVNGIDGFVAEFSTDAQTLVRSTPIGGTELEAASGVGVTPSGDVWIAGRTDSADFPIVNAFQPDHAGSADAFVARVTSSTPDNQEPFASAGKDRIVVATGCAASVMLDGTFSSDPDGDPLTFTWSGDFGTATGATPSVNLEPGVHTITLTVEDGRGGVASDTVVITVVANTPPQIDRVGATPNVLGPPNHQMVPVGIAVDLGGACEVNSHCAIAGVTSDEPIDGLGDGDTAPDWEVTGDLTLKLRAERSAQLDGRAYTVQIQCVAPAGNISRSSVQVFVPASR
jgi:PKD domain/Beta-propeller repeat